MINARQYLPRVAKVGLITAAVATLVALPALAVPAANVDKTGTKYKADDDMQAVLDELTNLNGKPIETLSPEEARKQPSH